MVCRYSRSLALAVALAGCSACAARQPPDVKSPAASLRTRSARGAVALALWNNAAFQTSVSQLGFARADLVEAGLLTNPIFSLLFPVGPKQLEATVRWSAEVLWERPKRVAAARLGAIRGGRAAGADGARSGGRRSDRARRSAFAVDRERMARDAATLLTRIDTLTQSRLAAGDIGALEARAATVDAARARQDAERAVHDVTIARERLRVLVGLQHDAPLTVAAKAVPLVACGAPDALLREALAARPDIRAAELTIEAATARLGWERSRVLTLTAVLDANAQGIDGFESGPGVDFSLPIFARNQGGRARAHAELQRAAAAYVAVQQQVALELREATAQFDQASQSVEAWRTTITSTARNQSHRRGTLVRARRHLLSLRAREQPPPD